jgi:hypothetical protein
LSLWCDATQALALEIQSYLSFLVAEYKATILSSNRDISVCVCTFSLCVCVSVVSISFIGSQKMSENNVFVFDETDREFRGFIQILHRKL